MQLNVLGSNLSLLALFSNVGSISNKILGALIFVLMQIAFQYIKENFDVFGYFVYSLVGFFSYNLKIASK